MRVGRVRSSLQGVEILSGGAGAVWSEKPLHVLVQELPEPPESFIHLDMVFTLPDKDVHGVYAGDTGVAAVSNLPHGGAAGGCDANMSGDRLGVGVMQASGVSRADRVWRGEIVGRATRAAAQRCEFRGVCAIAGDRPCLQRAHDRGTVKARVRQCCAPRMWRLVAVEIPVECASLRGDAWWVKSCREAAGEGVV